MCVTKGCAVCSKRTAQPGYRRRACPRFRTSSPTSVIEAEAELHDLKLWKAHLLTGDRAGTLALHVTKNWRITFWIDQQEIEIIDLDYEDYH